MAEQYTTLGQSTLNGAITSGATSLVVTSASSFPTSGDFRLNIENEILKVTGVSGTTFTVARGQEGTAAAAHSSGVTVTEVLTAAALDAIRSDHIATGTDASKASAKAGNLYLPSDGIHLYRDSGSAMVPWGPIYPFVAPVDGDFAWVNQGTAAVTTTYGGINLQGVADSSTNWRIRKKAAPATPYTIDIAFSLSVAQNPGYTSAGPLWRESATGKLIATSAYTSANYEPLRSSVSFFTNVTTFSSTPSQKTYHLSASLIFMRLVDDGTNRELWVSADGQYWVRTYQEGRTVNMTADEVGFGVLTTTAAIPSMTLMSWKQS